MGADCARNVVGEADWDLYILLEKRRPLANFRELRDRGTLHWWVGTRQFYSNINMFKNKLYLRTDVLQSEVVMSLID